LCDGGGVIRFAVEVLYTVFSVFPFNLFQFYQFFIPKISHCNHLTVIIGWPKNEDSIVRVESVKLCCPLSHLVISHGRLPIERANSAFDNPFWVIRS